MKIEKLLSDRDTYDQVKESIKIRKDQISHHRRRTTKHEKHTVHRKNELDRQKAFLDINSAKSKSSVHSIEQTFTDALEATERAPVGRKILQINDTAELMKLER